MLPTELLALFTPQEAEALVCGAPTIDVGVLKEAAEYEGGVGPRDRHIQVGGCGGCGG